MCYHRNYIVVEDLYAFLSEEKAKEAFDVFDTNHSGKVSQTEVHNAVLQIFTCALESASKLDPYLGCSQRYTRKRNFMGLGKSCC